MNLKQIITEVYNTIKNTEDKGELAAHIPELLNVNPNNFGVHISTTNQFNFHST